MTLSSYYNMSQQPSFESLPPSPPASRSSSIRSCSSSCSDMAESTHKELQLENHHLRQQHRKDEQRFAIVLEQFRQDEQAMHRLQQKVEELQASLEEANTKLVDVLEENHELRQNCHELRKNSTKSAPEPSPRQHHHHHHHRRHHHQPTQTPPMSRSATEPISAAQRRETFYLEDGPTEEVVEERKPLVSATLRQPVQLPSPVETHCDHDATPRPTPHSYDFSQSRRRAPHPVEERPLSPLSFNPAPAHRRPAISANQDSFLVRSLQGMSQQYGPEAASHRFEKLHSQQSTARLRTPALTPASSSSNLSYDSNSELVPLAFASAKKLPHPHAPAQWMGTYSPTSNKAVSAAC